MIEFTHCLGIILQSPTDLPASLGKIEQLSIVALETFIIWVLWKAYREKDNQLQDLTKKIIESDVKQLSVMERVEDLLQSLKHFGRHSD
jgi:hypothetical protein